MVSVLNLLGAPRVVGFFSKDLVLETGSFRHGSVFLLGLIYINVGLTYFYTYQLIMFMFSTNKLPPYLNQHAPSFMHRGLLGIPAVVGVVAGVFYLKILVTLTAGLVIPIALKLAPLGLNLLMGFNLFV